jgi:hypothetical protein
MRRTGRTSHRSSALASQVLAGPLPAPTFARRMEDLGRERYCNNTHSSDPHSLICNLLLLCLIVPARAVQHCYTPLLSEFDLFIDLFVCASSASQIVFALHESVAVGYRIGCVR